LNFEMDASKFNLDMRCPRCRHLVHAVPQTPPVYHISEHSDTMAYLIVKCPRDLCDISFVVYDRMNKRVTEVFPFPRTIASDFHDAIPKQIRGDFAEAKKCWYADAYKGVVVLCRRVMQQVAVDKGASGQNLFDQINDMLSQGLITNSLHDAAHEVRHFGNFGAHPRDDNLDDISRDDAKVVIGIVEQFLIDLFVRPADTAKLTKKRIKEK